MSTDVGRVNHRRRSEPALSRVRSEPGRSTPYSLASRDARVCGLRLYVERENHPARATYEKLGMHETAYRLYEIELRRGA